MAPRKDAGEPSARAMAVVRATRRALDIQAAGGKVSYTAIANVQFKGEPVSAVGLKQFVQDPEYARLREHVQRIPKSQFQAFRNSKSKLSATVASIWSKCAPQDAGDKGKSAATQGKPGAQPCSDLRVVQRIRGAGRLRGCCLELIATNRHLAGCHVQVPNF